MPTSLFFAARPLLFGVGLTLTLLLFGCPKPQSALGPGLRTADGLLAESKFREAIAAYKAASSEPPPGYAQRGIGLCHEALGEAPEAIAALEPARQAQPNDPVVRLALSRLYIAAGRRTDALTEAQHVYQHHPDNLTALLLLGALASSGEQAQQALDRLNSWQQDRSQARVPVVELFIARWQLHRMRGEAQEAANALKAAQTATLGHEDAAVALTSTYVALGHKEAAEQLLLAITKRNPARLDAQRRLAFLATDLDHYDIADVALSALTKDSATLDEAILRARVKVALGQAARVVDDLRTRIAQTDASTTAMRTAQLNYWLGKALTQTGAIAAAKDAMTHAVQHWPEMTPAHLALAELRMRDGALPAAIEGLHAALTTLPDAADLHGLLGSAFMASGDYVKAADAFTKRAALTPKDAAGPHLIGVALLAQGKHDEAEQQFRRALALDAGAVEPLDALAGMLLAKGKHDDEVEALYQRAVSSAGKRVQVWLAYARHQAKRGQAARALGLVQQALKVSPNDVGALGEATQIAFELRNYAEAERMSLRLLEVRPGFVPALNNLAVLYDEHLSQPDKALATARQAAELAPSDPHVQDTLGWILHRRGEHPEAVSLLGQAATTLPQNAVVQFHYGMALIGSGDGPRGKQQLRKALTISRNFPGADQARAALP